MKKNRITGELVWKSKRQWGKNIATEYWFKKLKNRVKYQLLAGLFIDKRGSQYKGEARRTANASKPKTEAIYCEHT